MSTDSYIHAALPGSPGGPLLLLFHGTGGNEQQLVSLGRELLPDASDRLAARRRLGARRGALLPPHRRGRLRHGRPRACARQRWRVSSGRIATRAKPSAMLGLGYSNGANILASVLFAEPDLFDAAVLMHPLIPFEPEIARRSRGQAHADHRRPARSDLPARADVAAGSAFARGEGRCHCGLARRRTRAAGRARSRRRGAFLAPLARRAEQAERQR